MSRYRSFVFTLNNYVNSDIDYLLSSDIFSYIVFNKEIGSSGTPHLQGYAVLKNRTTLAVIKKKCLSLVRAHIEHAITVKQAISYAKGLIYATGEVKPGSQQDGKYYEAGSPPSQGSREDLDECRKLVAEVGMRGVTKTCSFQQIKVAQAFLTYNEEPRNWKPRVVWLWGNSGSGKTLKAMTMCAFSHGKDVYQKKCKSKWWDGYDAHAAVIIDDFRGNWWELTEMLSLLDRYGKQVEVKGGWRQFRPRMIVVTSIYPPDRVYNYETCGDEPIQQLLRRIDETLELKVEGVTYRIADWERVSEDIEAGEHEGIIPSRNESGEMQNSRTSLSEN